MTYIPYDGFKEPDSFTDYCQALEIAGVSCPQMRKALAMTRRVELMNIARECARRVMLRRRPWTREAREHRASIEACRTETATARI